MERKQMLSHEVNKNKMTLNKQIRIGLSTIEFYEEEESKTNEELKSALTRIYDVTLGNTGKTGNKIRIIMNNPMQRKNTKSCGFGLSTLQNKINPIVM